MFRLRNVHLEEKRGWRGGRVLKFTSDVNLIQAIFLIWIAVKWTTKAIPIYRIPEREILNCRSQKNLPSITRAISVLSTLATFIRMFKPTRTQ